MKIEIKTVIILGLFGLIILALLCMLCQKPHIEKRLATTVINEVRSAGIDIDTAYCTERDVILYGTVDDSVVWNKAGTIASFVPGVRTVKNGIIVPGEPMPSQLQISLDSLLSDFRLPFEINSYRLSPKSKDILDQIDSLLIRFPEPIIHIIGHTDNEGDSLYNQLLSLDRAVSVRDELVLRGFREDRFVVFGKGENDPLTTNESAEGKERNRRVELIVNEK